MFTEYPDIMSVADIQKALGIGRTKAYELVNTGQIRSLKIGNAIRIPKPMLLDYICQKSYNDGEANKHRYSEGGLYESNGLERILS